MRYSLMITAGPDHPAATSALHLTRALLQRGHEVFRLFFYRDGVLLGNALTHAEQGTLCQAWRELIREYQLDAVICVSAALRRGVVNEEEAVRLALPAANLAPEFSLSGLGQWAEAVALSERILTLGP